MTESRSTTTPTEAQIGAAADREGFVVLSHPANGIPWRCPRRAVARQLDAGWTLAGDERAATNLHGRGQLPDPTGDLDSDASTGGGPTTTDSED